MFSKSIDAKLRSYSEVVRGATAVSEDEECVPGESLIKPEHRFFRYNEMATQFNRMEDIDLSSSSDLELPFKTPPKASNQEQKQGKSKSFEEEIDNIIDILSSPEKQARQDADMISISSDTSPNAKRVRRTLTMPDISSDETSLHDQLFHNKTEEMEVTGRPHTESKLELHFTGYPGKVFHGLYQAFSTVNRGLSVEEIMNILRNPNEYASCSSVPQYVQEPASFLIDSNLLKNKRDIRADGNGVWRIRNNARRKYQIDDTGIHLATSLVNEKDTYEIVRCYSFHKETPNFRRLIIELSDQPFVILQFYFNGEVVPVQMKPHGNRKSPNAPEHRRVATSTLRRMEEICSNSGSKSAKSVIKQILNENGGITNCDANKLPRNSQQVKNLKRKHSEENDEVAEVLQMYDTQTDKFIRKIDIRPDFVIVLASDEQLHDLSRFCTKQPCSILGVDPTFNFGNFDVTVTTYKHSILEDTTPSKNMVNTSPVFVGPICIHKKKDTTTYFNFMSTLIANKNNLKEIKAVGTDGEVALTNAVLMAFENVIHLRCFNHMKKNLQNKLRDMGTRVQNKNVIISDIFGKIEPSVTILGLVDSLTHNEFDKKLESLREKWEHLVPGFWNWFKKNESDTFKNNMLETVRSAAGLSSHQWYTTNDNESVNSALQSVCGKNLTLPTFIREVQQYIQSQYSQLHLAIVKEGNYRLRPEYRNFEVPLSTWAKFSAEERQKHIAKVNRCSVKLPNVPQLTNNNPSISVNVESSGILDSDVSKLLKDEMWRKAEQLLNTEFSVCGVPGQPDARRVASISKPKESHYVECLRKTGRIHCDCYLYRIHRICHHALACGEDLGVLGEYLKWRKPNKTFPLTQAINCRLPQSAGHKPANRQSWKRKNNRAGNEIVKDPLQMCDDNNSYIFRQIHNTKIMVCYGCGKKFRHDLSVIPTVPNDIVLARKEYRQYVNSDGELKMSFKKEFVHYHLKTECVRKKDTCFDPQNIMLSQEMYQNLTETHIQLLNREFGLGL